jgi:hypothetical protein
MSRAGYFDPGYDDVVIEPKLNFLDLYTPGGDERQLRAGQLDVPSSLIHELSHREQHKKALDNMKPNYDSSIYMGNNSALNALNYFDSEGDLGSYLDTQVWHESPEEWLAVADEVGYWLHELKAKGRDINYPISKETILNMASSSGNDIPLNLKGNLQDILGLFERRKQDTDPELWSNVMDKFVGRVNESYDVGERTISDENLKNFEGSMLKKAEAYDGGKDVEGQLYAEAINAGCSEEEASEIVAKVMKRLAKTKTGRKGGALGVAHQPTDQYKAVVGRLKQYHSY